MTIETIIKELEKYDKRLEVKVCSEPGYSYGIQDVKGIHHNIDENYLLIWSE